MPAFLFLLFVVVLFLLFYFVLFGVLFCFVVVILPGVLCLPIYFRFISQAPE